MRFPARNRSPLFEFPDRLMKEELPEGDFHIQEERRLFYVALTRAEDRLTMTTVKEKKGRVPVFIEDIVMDPAIKRRDVLQIAPKPKPARARKRMRKPRRGAENCSPPAKRRRRFSRASRSGRKNTIRPRRSR